MWRFYFGCICVVLCCVGLDDDGKDLFGVVGFGVVVGFDIVVGFVGLFVFLGEIGLEVFRLLRPNMNPIPIPKINWYRRIKVITLVSDMILFFFPHRITLMLLNTN